MDKIQNTFRFSVRFSLSKRQIIDCTEYKLDLTTPDNRPYIKLTSGDKSKPLKDWTGNLLLVGEGYPSEEDALADGKRWLDAIKRAFAHMKVGADFGSRAPKTIIFKGGLEYFAEKLGAKRVIHYDYGILVYSHDPELRLLTPGNVDITVGKNSKEISEAAIVASAGLQHLSEAESIAYDLFSASFFQPSVDGRFLMLMMAVETLITPAVKTKEAVKLLDNLILQVKQSSLDEGELKPLTNGIEALKRQSTRQAGKDLAKQLRDRTYLELKPVQFFTKCYDLRSSLVYGSNPRPTTDEVSRHVAPLELYVGDLLSLDLPEKILSSRKDEQKNDLS